MHIVQKSETCAFLFRCSGCKRARAWNAGRQLAQCVHHLQEKAKEADGEACWVTPTRRRLRPYQTIRGLRCGVGVTSSLMARGSNVSRLSYCHRRLRAPCVDRFQFEGPDVSMQDHTAGGMRDKEHESEPQPQEPKHQAVKNSRGRLLWIPLGSSEP